MTRDQLMCGETDLQEELSGQEEPHTVWASLRKGKKVNTSTSKGTSNWRKIATSAPVSQDLAEQLIGNPEKDQEMQLESTAESLRLDWTALGSTESGKPIGSKEEEAILNQWWRELEKETPSLRSQTSIPSSSSSSTEASESSPTSTQRSEIPNNLTFRYSTSDPLDAARPLWSHIYTQVPTGSQFKTLGLTVTADKMSSSMMISTVAGLVSMLGAESWIVMSATSRSRDPSCSLPIQLASLQLIPCQANGTTSRSTDRADFMPSQEDSPSSVPSTLGTSSRNSIPMETSSASWTTQAPDRGNTIGESQLPHGQILTSEGRAWMKEYLNKKARERYCNNHLGDL